MRKKADICQSFLYVGHISCDQNHMYILTEGMCGDTLISYRSEDMKITANEASDILLAGIDGHMMPEHKVKHSFCVANTASRIAKKCGLDGEYACILGLFHDIGCHLGAEQHPYNGYKYLRSIGLGDEYASVCLTHSFVLGDPNCSALGTLVIGDQMIPNKIIPYEYQDRNFVLDYLAEHKYSPYEKIINLCDLMCTDKLIGLNRRLVSLIERIGLHGSTQHHISQALSLQKSIENAMGCSMSDVFPEITDSLKYSD